MAALLPLLAMGIPALLSGVSGIMGIASEAKKLKGGKLARYRRRAKGGAMKHKKRRARVRKFHRKGKGIAADIIGSIPLLGSIAGPLVRALGGRMRKRGHKRLAYKLRGHKMVPRMSVYSASQPLYVRGTGLSPMYYSRPYSGMGLRKYKKKARRGKGMLYSPGGHQKTLASSALTKQLANYAIRSAFPKSSPKPATSTALVTVPSMLKGLTGKGLSPMYYSRPYSGMGLLAPAGGALYRNAQYRKGHLRKVRGRRARVRVKPSVVGGYKPYTFKTRPLMLRM